jgi:hypothetical protein
MTAEVEALLERLDSTARNKEHPMLPTGIIVYKQLAADASAVIGAQAEEIARLRAPYSGNLDPRLNHKVIPTAGRVQVDAISLGLLHQELDQLREQIAAAARQEPVAWISSGGDVSRSKKYFEEMGFTNIAPLYGAPVPVGDGRPVCPDCYRFKARNADDCAAGDCSKWHAVRDQEAVRDCKQFHDKTGYYAKPSVPADDAVSVPKDGLIALLGKLDECIRVNHTSESETGGFESQWDYDAAQLIRQFHAILNQHSYAAIQVRQK